MAADTTIQLDHPVTFGKTEYDTVVLREPHTGDVIKAQEESERLVPTPAGYQLVSSPARVGLNVLRRQVVQLRNHNEQTHDGPLSADDFERFHLEDFNRIQARADELDGAAQGQEAIEKAEARGRGEGEDPGD